MYNKAVELFSYDKRGTNSTGVSVGGLDLYFSYKTVVAFRHNGSLTVRENSWGPTTGHHLSSIDGGTKEAKAKRLGAEAFEAALAVAVAGV